MVTSSLTSCKLARTAKTDSGISRRCCSGGQCGEEGICVFQLQLYGFSQVIYPSFSEGKTIEDVVIDGGCFIVTSRSEPELTTQCIREVDQANQALIPGGFGGVVVVEDDVQIVWRELPLCCELPTDVCVRQPQVRRLGIEQCTAFGANVLEHRTVIVGEVSIEYDLSQVVKDAGQER